jgi:hypothetical protein
MSLDIDFQLALLDKQITLKYEPFRVNDARPEYLVQQNYPWRVRNQCYFIPTRSDRRFKRSMCCEQRGNEEKSLGDYLTGCEGRVKLIHKLSRSLWFAIRIQSLNRWEEREAARGL